MDEMEDIRYWGFHSTEISDNGWTVWTTEPYDDDCIEVVFAEVYPRPKDE